MARNYEKLEVWRLSYSLTLSMYKLIEKLPESESNNITDQIRRASTSIPLNIAEGTSRVTKNSYLQYLRYAYGSARELQVLLRLCKDLMYIDKLDYEKYYEELDKLSRKLFVFITKIEKEEFFK